jgi:hypothetical protein
MKLRYYKRSTVISVSLIIPGVKRRGNMQRINNIPKLALGSHTRDRMLRLEGIILLIYLNKQVVLFFYNIG